MGPNENVELISLDPDEAHTRLVERNVCDMLIYNVGAPASPTRSSPKYRCCTRLRRQAALAIVSDDENPATVSPRSVAEPRDTSAIPWRPILRCRRFRSFCMAAPIFRRPPFWPARPSARRCPSNTDSPNFPRSNRFRDAEQQTQAPPLRPDDGLYEQQGSPLRRQGSQPAALGMASTAGGTRPSLPNGSTPFSFVSARAIPTR